MKGISLFSSAGVAETYLKDIGLNIIASNELIKERANLHKAIYSDCEMVCGDILNPKVFKEILGHADKKVDFLLASPPCQGMSVAGKNRTQITMVNDERNYLIFRIIDFIKAKHPKFVLIENVPNFFKIELLYKGRFYKVTDILSLLFGDRYKIEAESLDASDYGIPQNRTRAIIKMYKKGSKWGWPSKENKKTTVEDAIGHLPSLESGEHSSIKWHFAREHSRDHVLWMKHTPTGKSAFENKKYFPKKENGDLIKSYNTTYRRIKWNEPAPTITMRNDAISSQLNVHPGRKLSNGIYSDARVLSPLELMILSSLPANWNIPDNTPELLIRKCLGECIPPLLIKKVIDQINC
jgi:DNA (cytosine-5)-methyltransferase 1